MKKIMSNFYLIGIKETGIAICLVKRLENNNINLNKVKTIQYIKLNKIL